MGTLTSQPYQAADGHELVSYLERLVAETQRMLAEGRVPDSDGVQDLLGFFQILLRRMRVDLSAASAGGLREVTTRLELDAQEYQSLRGMGESIRNLMEILELRKAVSLQRTEGADRASRALVGGTFAV